MHKGFINLGNLKIQHRTFQSLLIICKMQPDKMQQPIQNTSM